MPVTKPVHTAAVITAAHKRLAASAAVRLERDILLMRHIDEVEYDHEPVFLDGRFNRVYESSNA